MSDALSGRFRLVKLSDAALNELHVAFCCYWNYCVRQRVQYSLEVTIAEDSSRVSGVTWLAKKLFVLPNLRSRREFFVARLASLVTYHNAFNLYGFKVRVHPDTFHTGIGTLAARSFVHEDCSGSICGDDRVLGFGRITTDRSGLNHIGYGLCSRTAVIAPAHIFAANRPSYYFVDGNSCITEIVSRACFPDMDIAVYRYTRARLSSTYCYRWAMPVGRAKKRQKVACPGQTGFSTMDFLGGNAYMLTFTSIAGYSGLPIVDNHNKIVGFLSGCFPQKPGTACVRTLLPFLDSSFNDIWRN